MNARFRTASRCGRFEAIDRRFTDMDRRFDRLDGQIELIVKAVVKP